MSSLEQVRIRNFRSLADVSLDLGSLNVLFGPNGAGKSSLLEAVWFMRDCAVRGVEEACSLRGRGVGLLFDGTEEGTAIALEAVSDAQYSLALGVSSGRIDPLAGERLQSLKGDAQVLLERRIGSDNASFLFPGAREPKTVTLREPEKLSLERYIAFEEAPPEAVNILRLLRGIRLYDSRSIDLAPLKQKGSGSSPEVGLWADGANLWSVLRNLHDRKGRDERYDVIMGYMRRSFPSFEDVLLEQTGPATVYASFIEHGRRNPILASGASNGHLQMLVLLTALFSEATDGHSALLFDEPEVSLHPKALAVLGDALKSAASRPGKQVIVATHSPALLSQFDPQDVVAAEVHHGRTVLRRVTQLEQVQDLVSEYSIGSLYMAGVIAPQEGASDTGAP